VKTWARGTVKARQSEGRGGDVTNVVLSNKRQVRTPRRKGYLLGLGKTLLYNPPTGKRIVEKCLGQRKNGTDEI